MAFHSISVYSSDDVSPSLPATIMMDEDLPDSADEDLSSPHEFTLHSPLEDQENSPQSSYAPEATSDVEVDV